MSRCTYEECTFRNAKCEETDEGCIQAQVVHGQELVMVIRCRNCKWFMKKGDEDGHCRKLAQKVNRNWYCCDGKWKYG